METHVPKSMSKTYLRAIINGHNTVKKIQTEINHKTYKNIQDATRKMTRQGFISQTLCLINGKVTGVFEITAKGRELLHTPDLESSPSILTLCNPRLYHRYMVSLVIRRELDNLV